MRSPWEHRGGLLRIGLGRDSRVSPARGLPFDGAFRQVSALLLDLGFELLEPGLVFASVMSAEEKLATGAEYGANLSRCATTVATVSSG